MECKFTKDGKKVAVLGKLNNEEWIVQEIYVSGDKEFPGGENFVTKTLLDHPAETYELKNKRELDQRIEKLESRVSSLRNDCEIAQHEATATELINRVNIAYTDVDVAQLETLCLFMSGKITHCVVDSYSLPVIKTLREALKAADHDYGYRFEGLKLVSLFGCGPRTERRDDAKLSLDWRINQYRDGSGSWRKIWPCVSFDAAVAKVDELIGKEEKATEKSIELKKQLGLQNPSIEKITAYWERQITAKREAIEKLRAAEKANETLA